MSFFFDEPSNPKTPPIQPGPYYGSDVGFFEGIEAGFKVTTRAENSDAYDFLLREYMSPIVDIIEERTGSKFINPGNFGGMSDSMGHQDRMRMNAFNKIIEEIKSKPDIYPEYQDINNDFVDQKIKEKAKEELKLSANIDKRATTMGAIGQFIGSIGGTGVDSNFFELNLLTLGRLGSFGSTSKSLGKRMFAEGAVSAGIEAILQPEVKKWYNSLGIDYGWDNVFAQVTAAAAFGSAFPLAGKALALTSSQIKDGVDAYVKSNLISKKDGDLIKDVVDDGDITSEKPPPGVDNTEHLSRIEDATADVALGRLPELDQPENAASSTPTILTPEEQATGAKPQMDTETGLPIIDPEQIRQRISEIPDDEVIDRTESGLEIKISSQKKEIEDEDKMLDRLRDCVIR